MLYLKQITHLIQLKGKYFILLFIDVKFLKHKIKNKNKNKSKTDWSLLCSHIYLQYFTFLNYLLFVVECMSLNFLVVFELILMFHLCDFVLLEILGVIRGYLITIISKHQLTVVQTMMIVLNTKQ